MGGLGLMGHWGAGPAGSEQRLCSLVLLSPPEGVVFPLP